MSRGQRESIAEGAGEGVDREGVRGAEGVSADHIAYPSDDVTLMSDVVRHLQDSWCGDGRCYSGLAANISARQHEKGSWYTR